MGWSVQSRAQIAREARHVKLGVARIYDMEPGDSALLCKGVIVDHTWAGCAWEQ